MLNYIDYTDRLYAKIAREVSAVLCARPRVHFWILATLKERGRKIWSKRSNWCG